jgi:hypothetical protein
MIETLHLTIRLLGWLGLVQSLEFLSLRAQVSPAGIWRWQDLALDLAPNHVRLQRLLGLALEEPNFRILNWLRFTAAISSLVLPNWPALMILFITHVLTLLRWRGTFNGGSDAMNLLVLWTAGIAWVWRDRPVVVQGCLLYISLQLSWSYAKAGWLKISNPQWRNGGALHAFLRAGMYQPPTKRMLRLTGASGLVAAAAWGVMLFELTFPLSLLDGRLAVAYLTLGVGFHLANVYLFGLNRFFWAWLCAYPALVYVAEKYFLLSTLSSLLAAAGF